jgi:integrase
MCYILDFCKNKHFTDLTKRDIIAMQNYFLNDCGLSSARISFIKSVMNSLSTYIENILDDEFPNFRPIIRKIPNPNKSTVMDKTILSQEEMDKLLKQLVAKEMIQEAYYVALLISSGVRKSESLRIKLNWFNDENIIYGCMWKTPEEIKTKGRGVNGKMLTKYFLINKLKPYLDLWLAERDKLGVNIDDMFVFKNGDKWFPCTTKNLDYWVEKIEKVLGKRFHAHYCRHHYTTSMLEEGLPVDVVKDIVGW